MTPFSFGSQQGYILNARVARNIDGMDITLYEKALGIRRAFMNQYKQIWTGNSKQLYTYKKPKRKKGLASSHPHQYFDILFL